MPTYAALRFTSNHDAMDRIVIVDNYRYDIDEVIAANRQRRAARLSGGNTYNPATGEGANGLRREFDASRWNMGTLWLPVSMLLDPALPTVVSAAEFTRLRFRHDFEFWAFTCIKIHHKKSRRLISLLLNDPQRQLLALLERQRTSAKPLRAIVLKSRQWGCSTFLAAYMMWWEIVLDTNAHCIICSLSKDSTANIKNMIDIMLANYPPEWVMC